MASNESKPATNVCSNDGCTNKTARIDGVCRECDMLLTLKRMHTRGDLPPRLVKVLGFEENK